MPAFNYKSMKVIARKDKTSLPIENFRDSIETHAASENEIELINFTRLLSFPQSFRKLIDEMILVFLSAGFDEGNSVLRRPEAIPAELFRDISRVRRLEEKSKRKCSIFDSGYLKKVSLLIIY